MPLQAPELDTRSYDDLRRAALLRIPRYAPEWNDYNESDPGVALVELFAWLTEMTLFQLNQVPARNYIKFLQLLGLNVDPAEPARAHLTFAPRPGALTGSILRNSQVSAQVAGAPPLIFETTTGLDLIRLPLDAVQVFDGARFEVRTENNSAPNRGYPPFGWTPQVGSALYLGFSQTQPEARTPRFPQQMRFRIFLPEDEVAGDPLVCLQDSAAAPAPPAQLVWEFRLPGTPARWRRLSTYADGSVGFTREGYVVVEGPRDEDHVPTIEGLLRDKERYWLRVRVASGSFPVGRAPHIDFIRTNVVEATNEVTVRNEPLGVSDASPAQTFTLRQRPVVRDSLVVQVDELGEPPREWTRKDDFLASSPDDDHYTLNPATGEIRFGDGRRGRIPTAAATISAQVYRHGGGQAGNVGPNLLVTPLTSLVGVDSVTNERKATGGRDEQTTDEFLACAPTQLRHGGRAVSEEDFASLAKSVGGIARAIALPLFHPDHPDVEVPGAVTVVVIPDTLDVPPAPTPDELEAVCRYLDSRRLLTTELHVKGPTYLAVRVEARVAINPYAAFGEVERNVNRAINEYLNPLGTASRQQASGERVNAATNGVQTTQSAAGSGEVGSGFGLDLYPTNLISVIRSVEEVRAVPFLALTVDGRPHDDLTEPVLVRRDAMVYGVPDHDILVEPYIDR